VGSFDALEAPSTQMRSARSPNGPWLAFKWNRKTGEIANDLYAVFIINRNGTGLRRITPF